MTSQHRCTTASSSSVAGNSDRLSKHALPDLAVSGQLKAALPNLVKYGLVDENMARLAKILPANAIAILIEDVIITKQSSGMRTLLQIVYWS
jgi:hypothetical protein